MPSDEHLLTRIKSRDREALALLYARYLPIVWRYVFHNLRGDDQASRDVTSETFLAALRALTRDNLAVANISAWLIGIARHKLVDAHRNALPLAATPDLPSLAEDPTLALESADTRQLVTQILNRMDPQERTVLEWKYLDDLPVREIAQRLNRTEKAIEALLYRARNSFRSLHDASPLNLNPTRRSP